MTKPEYQDDLKINPNQQQVLTEHLEVLSRFLKEEKSPEEAGNLLAENLQNSLRFQGVSYVLPSR